MSISHRHTLRALARLLSYPDDALLAQAPAIADLLADGTGLSAPAQAGLVTLVRELLTVDPLALQAAYVETFDRGRRTSLHLFEHVHGDSRDRGPAMIDLGQMYAKSGLLLADGELPDYLPAVLEFASTQDAATARSFLGEMAHILHAVHDALAERGSAYAGVLAAVLDVAGEHAHAVARRSAPEADEPLDASWAEPEAFNGCSSAGQAAPDQAQPVHVVRRSPASQRSGAAA